MSKPKRLFLSPPWVGVEERAAVQAAFDSGYVAPCGPMVDEFERRIAAQAGRKYAVAVSGGTAAIDLLMAEFGVDESWTVIAPTLTFIATVGPAYHRGAKLVFVDCDETGNVDVGLLERALRGRGRPRPQKGSPSLGAGTSSSPHRMFIGVDLYGRCCDYDAIAALCAKYGAVYVNDSAEAVGATYKGRPAGSAGVAAVYSFNGNKIITTSGGGAVVTDDEGLAARARKRSQQSREPFPWYEHREVGYNYRMSNLLAAVGLAQLAKLPEILKRRRSIRSHYVKLLGACGCGGEGAPAPNGAALTGCGCGGAPAPNEEVNPSAKPWGGGALAPASQITFLTDAAGEGNDWLTVALVASAAERDRILAQLAAADIEARPVWKPLHLQSVFRGCRVYGGDVAEELFARGLCLPSGSGMTVKDLARVVREMA